MTKNKKIDFMIYVGFAISVKKDSLNVRTFKPHWDSDWQGKKRTNYIKRYTNIFLILGVLILSIIFCLVSLTLDWIQFGCPKDINFFQRSGAVLVGAALFQNWKLEQIPGGPTIFDIVSLTDKFRSVVSWLTLISFWQGVFGTAVWAYGDLLILDCLSECEFPELANLHFFGAA